MFLALLVEPHVTSFIPGPDMIVDGASLQAVVSQAAERCGSVRPAFADTYIHGANFKKMIEILRLQQGFARGAFYAFSNGEATRGHGWPVSDKQVPELWINELNLFQSLFSSERVTSVADTAMDLQLDTPQMSLALLETEALIPEQLRKVANISLFPLLGICDYAFWKVVVKQTAWHICRGVATLRPDASSRFIAVKEYCLPLKRVSLEVRPLLLARTGDLGDITGVFPRSQIYPRTERKTHQHVTTCKNGIGLLVSEVSKAPSLVLRVEITSLLADARGAADFLLQECVPSSSVTRVITADQLDALMSRHLQHLETQASLARDLPALSPQRLTALVAIEDLRTHLFNGATSNLFVPKPVSLSCDLSVNTHHAQT